jgi:transcriptional regulator with XRE-family HTH domain
MLKTKKEELIEELKELRLEKGITYQEIADKTAENGCPVSLSTIKHVFSDKYTHDHDYNNILKPIADVLSPPSEDDALETKTLQTRLDLKEEIIKDYKARLEAKDKKHKDREQFYMNLIEHLQAEISFKNEQIKHHNEAMDRKDATLKELYNKLLERE